MFLSIIIPTYNRSDILLERVMDYHQKVFGTLKAFELEFEVIVVNDASQDDTKQICTQLENKIKNFYSIHLKQNLGPGPARNMAISCANGDYIWFLDDDDTIISTHLDLLIECMLSGADVVGHSLKHTYNDHEALVRNFLLFREKQEVFNYVIKKDLIVKKHIQFSDNLHEDIAFIFKVFHATENTMIVQQEIIRKVISQNAITSSLTVNRIDGFIQSYNEIIDILGSKYTTCSELHTAFLGVILYLIQQSETELGCHLIDYLQKQPFARIPLNEEHMHEKKLTNFEVAEQFFINNLEKSPSFIFKQLHEIFNSYISCKDLESSLFLAPSEIRGCCKRFFKDGERKGDVVLMPADASITLGKINQAKTELIETINKGIECECTGCPYLTRYSSGPEQKQINYISFENFSYCNMRCSYCSPKYYGGTEAKYNTSIIIDDLFKDTKQISDCVHVVFGGGEPTLSPRFSQLNETLVSEQKVSKVRLLSNSLRYSPEVEELLKDNRYHLVTSVDAGTQVRFKEIRGNGHLEAVLSNLKKYSEVIEDKKRITIKYIITSENFALSELRAYVGLVSQYELLDCLFQISCDFTVEALIDEMVLAIFQLSCLLYKAGASFVFPDDLIRDRVSITDDLYYDIRSKITDCDVLCDQTGGTSYVLWGRGLQADWIMIHTKLGRSGLIKQVVSDSAEFKNYINNCDVSLASVSIIPAGVQSTQEIIGNIIDAGYKNLILRKVII